jgi:hypothetical protein
MTLTVRSATVSGATTKGSALTHAELDENFNHLSQSSNHSFTPSGSGMVAESMQSRSRWVLRLTDACSDAKRAAIRAGTQTDVTAEMALAQAEALSRGCDLILPYGQLIISDQLSYPSGYSIIGQGYGTNLVLDLTSGQKCFNGSSQVLRHRISNMQFSVISGGAEDVYAIYCDSSLRGGEISRIWTNTMHSPIYLGNSVVGAFKVSSLRLYRLSGSQTATNAFEALGNTIFCDDIEILGAFLQGIKFNACDTFALRNFNIAGSTGAEMEHAVLADTCENGTVETGWIEQIDTGVANGLAKAVYIDTCTNVTVKNINAGNGSVYFDGGSNNHASNIDYGEANGTLRLLNQAEVTADLTAFKLGVTNYSYGIVTYTDVPRDQQGIIENPTLNTGASIGFMGVTNGGIVTASDNTTTFQSGDRSRSFSVTSAFHGATITVPCVASKDYTVCVKVYLSSNATKLYLAAHTNTTRDTGYPFQEQVNDTGEWALLYGTFSSSTTSLVVRVLVDGVTNPAVFLIDSVQVFDGLNHFDPSNYETKLPPTVTTAAVGNVGADEDNLITYTLPANTLNDTGKGVRITAWGTTANNSNPKTVKLYFGSAILTTALTVSQVGTWRITADVYRTGSSTQDYSAQLLQGGATTLVDAEGGSLTETDTAAITIKCTGTVTDGGGGINNNDIVQEGLIVQHIRP